MIDLAHYRNARALRQAREPGRVLEYARPARGASIRRSKIIDARNRFTRRTDDRPPVA